MTLGLLYDLIMLIIVIMFCITGARRGIIRSIVFFIILILSLLTGYIVSGFITEPVYDNYVKDKVINNVKGPIEKFDIAEFINEKFLDSKLGIKVSESEIEKALGNGENISESISKYANSKGIPLSSEAVSTKIDSIISSDTFTSEAEGFLPSYFVPVFESAVSNDKELLGNVIQSLANTDKTVAAEEITDKAIKPVLLIALRTILFLLSFIAVWIILRIIVSIAKIGKNSERGGINTVLGGILGIVKGLIVVLLITAIVGIISPVISLIDTDSFFALSEESVNNSIFLRFINDMLN